MFEPKDIDGGVSDHSAPVGCSFKFSVRLFAIAILVMILIRVNLWYHCLFFFFGEELESQIFRRIYVAEPTHVSL